MKPDILSIQRTSETTVMVQLALPQDHPAFAGHFPIQPILPGVVQLDWAVQLGACCFGYTFRPATRVRVKFMQVIGPRPDGVSVSLRYDPVRQEIAFEYRIDDAVASNGSARFGP
jgi:3-hydroxymyristoyl/3-hydroxydecanoyl-(acyl carrier protein) dehydratase